MDKKPWNVQTLLEASVGMEYITYVQIAKAAGIDPSRAAAMGFAKSCKNKLGITAKLRRVNGRVGRYYTRRHFELAVKLERKLEPKDTMPFMTMDDLIYRLNRSEASRRYLRSEADKARSQVKTLVGMINKLAQEATSCNVVI